jgi:hypothetical protein
MVVVLFFLFLPTHTGDQDFSDGFLIFLAVIPANRRNEVLSPGWVGFHV